MIEFAQREPPNHRMSPTRVLLKIQKGDPPKLENPSFWSKQFIDFIARCVTKDPKQRASADELLEHSFLKSVTDADKTSVLVMISEYKKAEVFEKVNVKVNGEDVSLLKRARIVI